MLEYHDRITVKITSIHQSQCGILFNNKDPPDVTVEEALLRRVGIRIRIRESMV